MKLLVTGGTGFVGARFCSIAEKLGHQTIKVLRKQDSVSTNTFLSVIDSTTNWVGAFEGIDCIVHCAARVHQMNDSAVSALEAYREVNTLGTLNLARQAAAAGVKRFVFLSSIKVNGEFSTPNQPFISDNAGVPDDPYSLSKYEAEQLLKLLAEETGLEVVVIRPPLVYGPGVKANFLTMMNWVCRGIPLPLGSIHNKRSLVYVDNLVDLMLTCCQHPQAAGETFLVSDDHEVSTTELLSSIANTMGMTPRLLPVSASLIKLMAKLLGKSDKAQRLCSDLQVDISKTKNLLNWTPPVPFEKGIEVTVASYLNSKKVTS